MEDFIGTIWKQKDGELQVLEKTSKRNRGDKGNYFYKCKFLKDGYETLSTKVHIKQGNVANPLTKNVMGIACLGIGPYSYAKNLQLYKMWYDMLYRCYSINADRYPYYGGKGVKVCEEWLNFQVFAKWFEDNSYICKDLLSIDKDILANINHKEANEYSPENCILIPYSLNSWLVGEKPKSGVNCIKDNFKFYSEISINKVRYRIPQTNSFKEAKEFYANKKYEQWIKLIKEQNLPNYMERLLLQYDFSWSWVWKDLTKEEIINNFYIK